MKIAAIIVTYNRKQLLEECLESLLKQTKRIDGIYIVDNCSSDGTEDLLFQLGYIRETPPDSLTKPWRHDNEIVCPSDGRPLIVHYIKMNRNVGGAGGFYEGLKSAFQDGYYWFWLMDDDTIPLENALEKLLEKLEYFDKSTVGFACSKVLWKDKTVHKMNIPEISGFVNGIPFNTFEENGILLVRSASFVSLLTNRDVVRKVGLPIKDFFIWFDDVEFTYRITKSKLLGIYVKDSIVLHKTSSNCSASEVYDWRFYYNARNRLWYFRLHYSKAKYALELLRQLDKTFKLPKGVRLKNLKACFDSLIKLPKVEFPANDRNFDQY